MSSSILNLFLQGMECQELAPVLSRVDLALQYRKDWPTPITTIAEKNLSNERMIKFEFLSFSHLTSFFF